MLNTLKSIDELSQMEVLYVEDDDLIAEAFIMIIKHLVKSIDHFNNGKDALEAYKKSNHDIIITDIKMPIMNGLEMSKAIRIIDDDVPIIIVSAYNETSFLKDAFEIGITYYLNKPVNRIVLMRTLNESAKSVVYKRHQEEIIQNYEDSIDALVDLIERRDRYTAGHSTRVAKYSMLIARAMGLDDKECDVLEKASKLHDIGKIEIPDSILLNPGKLNDLEFSIVKEHLNSGYAVLSQIKQYEELAEIMRHHHERYDGSGYPQGISGSDIPLLSHIMIVADVFDAMTTNRIYKPRQSVKDTLAEIKSHSGTHYHPEVVKIACDVLASVELGISKDQLPNTQLEEKKFSYFFSDLLTGLFNENYLKLLFKKNEDRSVDVKTIVQIITIDLHNFSHYNKKIWLGRW